MILAKKLLKILLVIIGILLIFVIGIIFWWKTVEAREVKAGIKQNEVAYTLDNIKEPIDVLYLGDSISTGVIGNESILQSNDTGYRDNVDNALKENNVYGSSINFAVPGYTTADTLDQLHNDLTYTQTNTEIINHGDYKDSGEDLSALYPETSAYDPTITEAIKNADVIFVTLGANDVLSNIDVTDGITIDYPGLLSSVGTLSANKKQLYSEIHAINPDVKIMDIGMYFAYPHIGDVMHTLYPVLVIAESKMFMDKPKDNIYGVTIRDNMQPNIKEWVVNPNDVHATIEGYDIISNEILKELNKAYK